MDKQRNRDDGARTAPDPMMNFDPRMSPHPRMTYDPGMTPDSLAPSGLTRYPTLDSRNAFITWRGDYVQTRETTFDLNDLEEGQEGSRVSTSPKTGYGDTREVETEMTLVSMP